VSLARAEAGAKGGSSVRWHREPCPAEFPLRLLDDRGHFSRPVCKREQKWAGDRYPGHVQHLWTGEHGGKRVEVAWEQQL
jgi:hypothetical protein